MNTADRIIRRAFRPRARLLQPLGDQLICSPQLALFELAKSAYDAGAARVRYWFTRVSQPPWLRINWRFGQSLACESANSCL